MMFSNSIRCLQTQYFAAFIVGMGMLVTGATFVWVSPILPYLNGPDALIPMDMTQISWMISLVEVGSAISPVISGVISERWGRRSGILLGFPFIVLGWVLILVTRDPYTLYLVRLIHGFGLGALFTIVPIYLGEIAAIKVRGTITSVLQTMWYAGFLFQYNVGSYFSYETSAWVNLIISIIVFILFYLLPPETPFFLMINNQEKDASKSLMLLRGKQTSEEISSELQIIKDCVNKDMKNKFRWTDIFHLSSIDYKILLLVQLLSVFRLCSGTISISAYINDLLRRTTWNKVPPELIMSVFSSITLVVIIIATLIIDYVGRRPLLLLSCVGTTITNLVIASYYYIAERQKQIDSSSIGWIPAITFVVYTIFFAIGLGPVTQTIQSELFPTNIRALGNVVTSYNLTITSFICLRCYQVVVDYIGVYANFLFFSANTLIGAIVIYKYIPETKGKSFLEIQEFFAKEDKATKEKPTNDPGV